MAEICITLTEEQQALRKAVYELCQLYPGAYWRELDEKREYPEAFVQELTKAGYLSILIPEEFGGSGLGLGAATAVLEEIHRSGCNGGACHRHSAPGHRRLPDWKDRRCRSRRNRTARSAFPARRGGGRCHVPAREPA